MTTVDVESVRTRLNNTQATLRLLQDLYDESKLMGERGAMVRFAGWIEDVRLEHDIAAGELVFLEATATTQPNRGE